MSQNKLEELNQIYKYLEAHFQENFEQLRDFLRSRTEAAEGIGIQEGAEKVVRNADILITATRATTPIVKGEWINEGIHINAIGADCPLKMELAASTLKKADKLVIDYELALDTGEIRVPMNQGILSVEDIYGTIGEIVAGVKPGRETSSEITIFESTGMALPYVAINAKIYEKAREMGLGTDIGAAFTDLVYS